MLPTTQGVTEPVEILYDSSLHMHRRDPYLQLKYRFGMDTLAPRP